MEDRVNILAVDDNPDKLLALEAVLSELGERVVTASSGREALRALLTDEFAVVLLDVNMPGMDGFETASLLRQRKNSEHTPIIFVTSYGDETHASRGYQLGAVDYILAPVDSEVLKTKVSVFVELFRKTLQVRHQARILEQRAIQLQRLTEASLAINSALSPEEMLRTLTSLARDILGAHQAVAVMLDEGRTSAPESAVSLSPRYEESGERPVLRDAAALPAFLAQAPRTVRVSRGDRESVSAWRTLLASDRPARLGWMAAPLSTREGRPIGLLHVLDKREGDFTDEDEAILTQLAQMTSVAIENILNAEAREANRVKDEFLTTLSHELRTPLSAILGWTRTLRDGPGEADRLDHGLEVIERNVRAQAKLIDDLLDVSRIITGKLRLNVRTAALGPIVEAAMESMRPAAEAKDIRIQLDRAPGGDDTVVGDPDRLQQVVWNLVSNAIKFTPRGGRVRVELGESAGGLDISVTDTGRGISPEFLPRVFERFRQADSTTTRTHGGLGIGLAIARHLVELHGGTITAESGGTNRGARFIVHLPRVAPEAPEAVPAVDSSRAETSLQGAGGERLDGLRVLLVEDEPDSREILEHILVSAGATVDAAASVRAALELFKARPPGVVVSDIGMPGQDGYDLIRSIRGLPPSAGAAVAAIALTAYAREEDRQRALAAGFDLHIPKPVDPRDLVAAIARLARPAGRPTGGQEDPLAPASGPNNGDVQPAYFHVLVVEDDCDSREGLKNLLELWGHSVEVAEDGAQAVERAVRARPAVALIDIGLPEIDGYEVANRIRQALGGDGIYLVALTGHAGNEDRERALASGFDAHVSKPIDFSRLSTLLAARTAPPLAPDSTS
jgi:CheY-like chemotaxis protein